MLTTKVRDIQYEKPIMRQLPNVHHFFSNYQKRYSILSILKREELGQMPRPCYYVHW